jgi:Reverse transcriptase (RNA-dependent DNA polymerase)
MNSLDQIDSPGGRICININGSLIDYFECTRGVRQGNPLSPMLFVFAAEGLGKLFHRGVARGLFQGLRPLLADGSKVSHQQYADYTLLLLQLSSLAVDILKWILVAFESFSGLKINYAKSDVYPVNLSPSEGTTLASQLGCKVNYFPLTYLGVLIHWRKPPKEIWHTLLDKIEKKLSN